MTRAHNIIKRAHRNRGHWHSRTKKPISIKQKQKQKVHDASRHQKEQQQKLH